MQIGKLRHRITIQTFATERAADGGVIRNDVDTATVWASVEPMNGREILDGVQIEAQITHRVKFRRRQDVSPHDKIIHLGRTFHIEAVHDINERHFEQMALCREVIDPPEES